MSLAYHILAHKNPHQVWRLLNALYHEDDVFVLHFDRRSPQEMHTFAREWAAGRPGVIIQHPRKAYWGGPVIVDIQCEAMNLALQHDAAWTHFIDLSGQDFPLATRETMIAELSRNPDASFLDWFDPFETRQWSNLDQRVGRWHFHSPILERALRLPGLGRRIRRLFGWENRMPFIPGFIRKLPFFRYFGGSNHAVLSRAACQLIISDPLALKIRRWLTRSVIPDESIFQSVLLNSPLRSTLVPGNRRLIDFPPNAPHPRTFGAADFPRLERSDAWFARKFDETEDPVVFDLLERLLLEKRNRAHPAQ